MPRLISTRFRIAKTHTGRVKTAIRTATVIKPGSLNKNEAAMVKTVRTKIPVVSRTMIRARPIVSRFLQVMTAEPTITKTHNVEYRILSAASATPGKGCGMTRARTKNNPNGVIEVITPAVATTALSNFCFLPLVDDFPMVLAEEERAVWEASSGHAAVHHHVERTLGDKPRI